MLCMQGEHLVATWRAARIEDEEGVELEELEEGRVGRKETKSNGAATAGKKTFEPSCKEKYSKLSAAGLHMWDVFCTHIQGMKDGFLDADAKACAEDLAVVLKNKWKILAGFIFSIIWLAHGVSPVKVFTTLINSFKPKGE
ncbi:hypothetical protein DACRYDRAFT_110503 [Dacryopinax primogenitus]|uniref:Uncharacterized protein n=1 Tax=Dacryopinax primogenitus (strain DJM 731) TaxID=1858805 RepID=M5FT85_DACPD|nr:uncharacterized protein DACRYDRAFT_110503 [Dacryopinax primogenitus]EJT98594.1 hypothetical protein DACRYDRAFT_110503 [Dacryopinax primogenitus]